MKNAKAELLQGTLDMLILKALSLGELHGYGIMQRIQQISDDLLLIEQGSLYPALYRLDQQGWISSEWGLSDAGRKAKLYKLTKAGRKQLAVEESNWNLLTLAISKVMHTG
jgi:PadR family transcriptional regulator PadR